jgi:Arc/MetJ-type ribon-helix-helix transcriptional regulator
MKDKTDSKKVSITARVDPDLHEKLMIAIEKSGVDQSDVLREALRLGLDELEIIDYRIKDAIRDAIARAKVLNPPALPKQETQPDAPALSAMKRPTPDRMKRQA